MAEEITATLIVRFGEIVVSNSDNGFITMEVDTSSGKTTFSAGDDIPFNVYKSSRVGILKIFQSVANSKQVGVETKQVTQIVIFSNTDTASLDFPAVSGIGVNWLGTNRGGLSVIDQKILKAGSKITGVVEITYTTQFTKFLLFGTPGSVNEKADYQIVIAAVGTVT